MSGRTLDRYSAEVVIEATAAVGEGPVLDHRTGRLCWVDLARGTLFESDLTTGEQRESSLGMLLGAAIPQASGTGFAVAVTDGFGFWDDDVLKMVDPVLNGLDARMNDAKCDSNGRLWAGSTDLAFEPGAGKLHRWGGSRPSEVIAERFTLPNGLGWNATNTTMYLADSMAHVVLRADFELDTGDVGPFTPYATVKNGLPDGLAVDTDDCVWVAIWGGGEVHRIDPSGTVIGIIATPASQPSSCAFAEDGVLYITSARSGLDGSALKREPLAGSVFAVQTNTRGVPVRGFGSYSSEDTPGK